MHPHTCPVAFVQSKVQERNHAIPRPARNNSTHTHTHTHTQKHTHKHTHTSIHTCTSHTFTHEQNAHRNKNKTTTYVMEASNEKPTTSTNTYTCLSHAYAQRKRERRGRLHGNSLPHTLCLPRYYPPPAAPQETNLLRGCFSKIHRRRQQGIEGFHLLHQSRIRAHTPVFTTCSTQEGAQPHAHDTTMTHASTSIHAFPSFRPLPSPPRTPLS